MKAVAIDRFGGPETLKTKTVPVPETGPNEVLIRVEFAGVGAWDPYEREGGFTEIMQGKPKFPYVLGSEGSGTVAGVGKNVDRFSEGDKVYSVGFLNPKGGFFAEYIVVNADLISHIPGGLNMEQASVLLIDGVTALRGLDDVLHLEPDESVMIFGASGGIGHLAVQLAKRMGTRVFAVASGDDGVKLAERLGADVVVDGRGDGVLDGAREFAPDGIDAALVTSGGDETDLALSAIRGGGRVAYPNGVMPVPNAPSGVTVDVYNGDADREIIEKLNTLIESGDFEVRVDRVFPLDEAADAQEALGTHHLGKFALKVS